MMTNPSTYRVVYVEPGSLPASRRSVPNFMIFRMQLGEACLNAYTRMMTGLF